VTEELQVPETVEEPVEPVKAPPIESRFLFVDVAALRAKQLRRGALPRLEELRDDAAEVRSDISRKAERVAMEEVNRGLVLYDLPGAHPLPPEDKS
jgi:DNA-directed RNA polymerase subunit K/omega